MQRTTVSTAVTKAPEGPQGAAARYAALETDRNPYLTRARRCAALTIPSLIPPDGNTGANNLPQPFQSTGADCVNNLAAKLLMALYPPGTPFFRLTVEEFIVEELAKGGGDGEDIRAMLEETLGKIERTCVGRMETQGTRKVNFEALLHLIVSGNGLKYIDNKGKQKFFPLDRYVIARDLDDNVLDIVVKECISKSSLPPKIREVVSRYSQAPEGGSQDSTRDVELFTWVRRDEASGGWKVHQECHGEIIPGTEGSYPEDAPAWIPLRWTKIAGEAYGRGRCEEYLGDLQSLERLTQAIVEFAAIASKVVCMVDESGVTDKEELARAPSGAVLDGNAKEVTFLQVEKMADFQVARSVAEEVKVRLERGFLHVGAIQRQAERVTAEEIRLMAGELDQGLGGTYSILAEEGQRPEVARYLALLQKDKSSRIPKLPKGTVRPQIVTGLDGLGRNTDMQRLDSLLQGAEALFGVEEVAKVVPLRAYLARRGAALGVDMTGLLRSEEEIQAQNQRAQKQAMIEKLGPTAIGAVSENIKQRQQLAAQQPVEQ